MEAVYLPEETSSHPPITAVSRRKLPVHGQVVTLKQMSSGPAPRDEECRAVHLLAILGLPHCFRQLKEHV